ncbi:MAG: T9SS type A sorting domain-containing protein, partial [Bdellovibrionales bacterium]|nr:T9SS type A sorting domain-containing protein [Bdellovibrionales bacterium]
WLECDWETAVTPEIYPRPEYFSTIGNYPNPFNGQTTLQFELPDPKEVRLSLYDLAGRKIKEENLGRLSAGGHSIEIELGDLPSGLCFAQFEFQSGNQVERFTHQMLEIK